MLFSEPKIPQLKRALHATLCWIRFQCSSASRKFLNHISSFLGSFRLQRFQCSSASRKFLNSDWRVGSVVSGRAFQCSSASRKFLNAEAALTAGPAPVVSVLFSEPKIPQFYYLVPPADTDNRFSALQRAENSSIFQCPVAIDCDLGVSVLFSEPKIPQSLYIYA